MKQADRLRSDAISIWQAGVCAVAPNHLIRRTLRVEGANLWIADQPVDLRQIDRIAVVGAGKASAAMARAVEETLGPRIAKEKNLTGWINVPADQVDPQPAHIHLHAARPATVNEPTEEGAAGTRRILEIVDSLGPRDLCLCLISGGGSALLPAPVQGVTVEDKRQVALALSEAGVQIGEINTVRSALSRIKCGGLARACRASRLVGLIISDVLGDPLPSIASGPTIVDQTPDPARALDILERANAAKRGVSPAVFEYLHAAARRGTTESSTAIPTRTEVRNLLIGNNATAVDGAGIRAESLGYRYLMRCDTNPNVEAEAVGRQMADLAVHMLADTNPDAPDCLITGGEPVVRLADRSIRGKGGRNQQLVLAALVRLLQYETPIAGRLVILSGGTDGEDGPTDAAGAVIDDRVLDAVRRSNLDPADYLARNDAYRFFQSLDSLLITGPTGTNVCDLRVALIEKKSSSR